LHANKTISQAGYSSHDIYKTLGGSVGGCDNLRAAKILRGLHLLNG